MSKARRLNPKAFYGARKQGPYFEGWYLKHQTEEGAALALIPALHIDPAGRRSASLQVVAEGRNCCWITPTPTPALNTPIEKSRHSRSGKPAPAVLVYHM